MTELAATPDPLVPEPMEGDDLQATYEAEIARAPYQFRWADRWWTLPHIAELDYKIQVEIEQFGEDMTIEKVDDLFRRIFGPEQADAWTRVTRPLPFLEMMFSRWIAYCGRKSGESQASTDSSPSTERPSKRTSTGTTGSGSRSRSTEKKATPRKAATRRASS